MQPLAGGADPLDQLAFDERVHVLVAPRHERRVGRRGLAQLRQRAIERLLLVSRQHASAQQGLGPRATALDVVFEEATVEGERRSEGEHVLIGGTRKTARPQVRHHSLIR